jgi:rhamnosyltransferase
MTQIESTWPGNVPSATSATANRPKVLVLLATYNGAHWIRSQIESILRQEEVDVAIVARDDRSSDSTSVEICALATRDSRIVSSCATEPSGSAARNFFSLIRSESGKNFDFVAFADQDDVWNEDKLRRACCALQGTAYSGYSSAVLAEWPNGKAIVLRQRDKQTVSDFLFEGAGQGCTFVISRAFYERLRSFAIENSNLVDSVHYHDWAVYALARSWGLRWKFDPIPTIHYRQHGGNDTGARTDIKGITTRLRRIKNGWYKSQLRSIAAICRAAAPSAPTISSWQSMTTMPPGWRRRLCVIRFCIAGGRRRILDNLILIVSALAGWI